MAKRKKNSATDSVEMVPAKNGGQILAGGMPGNAGGIGRPPSAIREHCRGSFAERVPILEMIADGKPLPMTIAHKGEAVEIEVSAGISERVKAIDVLAKYGGVDKLALTVDEQPEREWTPERLAEAWGHIQAVRSIQQLERLLIGRGTPEPSSAGD